MLYDFILRNVYVVKARRDTEKTTGNSHINIAGFFSHSATIIIVLALL